MRGRIIELEVTDKRGKAAKTIPLYQYDYGQKLLIKGVELPEYYEVHFSNQQYGDAITVLGDSTGVLIPDSLVATGETIYVWLFLHDTSYDGETEYMGAIPVIKRAQPTDVTPTPEEQSIITEVIAALNNMEDDMSEQVQAAESAKEAAQTAQTAAEGAATTASGYVDTVTAAQSAAEAAQAAAETAATSATASATSATSSANSANNALAEATNAKIAAVDAASAASTSATTATTASGNASNYATSAESAKVDAVAAKVAAEAAQTAAETAQGKAEDAQGAAETAQTGAETAQTAAETAQGKAEDAQTAAESAQESAEDSAEDSEAYAVGTRNGVDVESDDPAYENNAKYYAEEAATVLADKLDAPATAGTAGQVLTSDGEGGQAWADPSGAIDDTSGEGDTDVTWSADKLAETTGQLLTAIHGITPDAQQSDIGKALILKTIDQTGKPTAFEYGEAGGGSVDPSVVEQKVDEWLEENISNPDSPPLDRSLSSGSAAAPADMVGVINEELDFVTGQEDLLTNAVRTDGKGLDGSGAIINSSNYEIYEIEYDGSYGTFTASVAANTLTVKAIAFYNASDVLISALDYKTTSGASVFTNQTIPENTAKIVLSNRKKSGSVSASYPVQKSQRLEDIEDDIADNEKEILKALSVMQYSEKNLFNVGTALDGIIAPSNGEFSESDEYTTSDFIPVEPNTIYTISARNTVTGLFYLAGCRYAIYTSAKAYITGEQSDYGQFRTPSNAAYVRFSLKKPVTDIQFERRSFATKYVPYHGYAIGDESDYMFLNYPRKVFAVPGLEYNWYMFNVTPEKHSGLFDWVIKKTNTKIHNYGRFLRWEDNNTSVGTEKVIVEATSETKRGTKIFDIVSSDPADLDNVSVLVLGDSTTANGYVVTDLHGYEGNENKITTLGTLGTAPYNHEGRSGWTLNGYFTTSANNPFYNPSTQTFDAEYYFNQTGVDVPDLFIINLGINDMHYDAGSLYDAKNTADEFINKVNTVITSLRNVDANMKVAICMTIPPNVDPWGFGAAGTNIIGYDEYRIANLVLCEKLIDEFDYRESEGLYLIPINASLDTQYNMPTSAQLPNSRAAETIMLPDTAGNVHPNAGGYYQIADVIYAFLCATFKTT